MTDETPTPFSPFLPENPQPATDTPPPKKKRGPKKGSKRAAKKAATPIIEAKDFEPVPTKKVRKPRTPRPATVPIDLLVVASGLDEKAAQVFAGVAQALSQLRKPSRRKLVEALQKLS